LFFVLAIIDRLPALARRVSWESLVMYQENARDVLLGGTMMAKERQSVSLAQWIRTAKMKEPPTTLYALNVRRIVRREH